LTLEPPSTVCMPELASGVRTDRHSPDSFPFLNGKKQGDALSLLLLFLLRRRIYSGNGSYYSLIKLLSYCLLIRNLNIRKICTKL